MKSLTAGEFLNHLNSASVYPNDRTCDTIKSGSADQKIHKVAVSMFGTVKVLQQAIAWGADFMVVHEPLYYNHWDDSCPNAVALAKKKMIDDAGLTIIRYHDHMHSESPDGIFAGEMNAIGLSYRPLPQKRWGINRIILEDPITARELAELLEEKLKIAHVRIAGECDKPGKTVSCCFGAAGDLSGELEQCDFVLAGEVCEWQNCELARDYAALGRNKAILALGHVGSERDGMKLLAERLQQEYPELELRYFDCEEVYSYAK